MTLDLTDEEIFALLNLLVDTIEADRYPMSPRIRLLREILTKCGQVGGLPPELAARLRRYTPPPPAPPANGGRARSWAGATARPTPKVKLSPRPGPRPCPAGLTCGV